MKPQDLKTLVLTHPFFVESAMYSETVSNGDIVKQTKEGFEYGGITIGVNLFIDKENDAHIELNLQELEEDIEEEYAEQVEDFMLDPRIVPSLTNFLTKNTNKDFTLDMFSNIDVVTPEEGVVEIVLNFTTE